METKLEFVLPDARHRADVRGFYDEFRAQGETCIGYGGYEDFDAWLTGMRNRRTGTNLPQGYVPENFYLCYADGVLVGVLNLKFTLTEYLLNYGGHIGYAVRPSRRRQGLATRMLGQSLEIARTLGMTRLLCVCDADNLPSERTILRNGGVLEDVRFDPEERVEVKRYWITL